MAPLPPCSQDTKRKATLLDISSTLSFCSWRLLGVLCTCVCVCGFCLQWGWNPYSLVDSDWRSSLCWAGFVGFVLKTLLSCLFRVVRACVCVCVPASHYTPSFSSHSDLVTWAFLPLVRACCSFLRDALGRTNTQPTVLRCLHQRSSDNVELFTSLAFIPIRTERL